MVATVLYRTKRDYYGVKLLLAIISLLLFLSYTSFYLMQHYVTNSFLTTGFNQQKIYFLQSDTLADMYQKNQMNYQEYLGRVEKFKKYAQQNGFTAEDITTEKLSEIQKNAIVIALDMMALQPEEIDEIENFVNNGGSLLFNYTAGFLNQSLQYQRDNLVSRLTPLKMDPKISIAHNDKNSASYISTRLASVINKYLPKGSAKELILYDSLPIFKTPKNLEADAYITNWSQTNYAHISNSRELKKSESGLIWHGYKGAGKWVYFSFPSYLFIGGSSKDFAKLFQGMLEFLNHKITITPYPYIDAKNGIFVSEDTEYKFENLLHFYNASKKYNIPVTAFCVAHLAEKHPEIMKEVAGNQIFEIASHSYSHKKIVGESNAVYKREIQKSKTVLKKLTGRNIIGFRPPREEIDNTMIHLLEESGYKYILSQSENRLFPYFYKSIVIIPRHATDDYSYLINLNWDSKQILASIIHQADVVTSLNGLYTFSSHSHLMSFGTNINILKNFFAYINMHKELRPMNGAMIQKRVELKSKLSYTLKESKKNIVLSISNNNSETIKNLHFELTHSPDIKITKISSEIIGLKTTLHKESDTIDTIVIQNIQPHSEIILFLGYVETH